MIDKFDYSDLYKFLVSAGIVLIGLALLLPWIYLKEPFDIMIEQQKILLLTPQAQEIVNSRQNLLIYCYPLIPWVSGILLISGFVSVIYGLLKWFSKQADIDKKDKLEAKKTEIEFRKMSDEEIKEKIEREYQKSLIMERADGSSSTRLQFTKQYLSIEKFFIDKIKELFSSRYEIQQNVRFENYDFDLLLTSKSEEIPDYIIEFEYLVNKTHLIQYNMDFTKQLTVTKEYKTKIKDNTISLLITVVSQKNLLALKIENMESTIHNNFFKIIMVGDDLSKLDDEFFISIFEGDKKNLAFYVHKPNNESNL